MKGRTSGSAAERSSRENFPFTSTFLFHGPDCSGTEGALSMAMKKPRTMTRTMAARFSRTSQKNAQQKRIILQNGNRRADTKSTLPEKKLRSKGIRTSFL